MLDPQKRTEKITSPSKQQRSPKNCMAQQQTTRIPNLFIFNLFYPLYLWSLKMHSTTYWRFRNQSGPNVARGGPPTGHSNIWSLSSLYKLRLLEATKVSYYLSLPCFLFLFVNKTGWRRRSESAMSRKLEVLDQFTHHPRSTAFIIPSKKAAGFRESNLWIHSQKAPMWPHADLHLICEVCIATSTSIFLSQNQHRQCRAILCSIPPLQKGTSFCECRLDHGGWGRKALWFVQLLKSETKTEGRKWWNETMCWQKCIAEHSAMVCNTRYQGGSSWSWWTCA